MISLRQVRKCKACYCMAGILAGIYILIMTNLKLMWAVIIIMSVAYVGFIGAIKYSRQILLGCIGASIIFYLDIHLSYVDHIGLANGLTISLLDVVMATLLIRKLFRYDKAIRWKRKTAYQVRWLFAGLWLTGLLSLVNSPDIELTLVGMIQLSKMMILFVIISNEVRQEKDIQIIVKSLTVSLGLLGSYCFIQYLTKTNLTLAFEIIKPPAWYVGGFAPVGTSGSSNVTAGQLATLLPFGIASYIASKNKIFNAISIASVLLGFAILILTQSRSAWCSSLVSIGLFVWLAYYRGVLERQHLKFIVSVIIVTIIVGSLQVDNQTTIESLYNVNTLVDRINLIKASVNMIVEHPVVGVGLNNYTTVMHQYYPIYGEKTWEYLVHNNYAMTFAELGSIGGSLYVLFFYYVYRNVIGSIKRLKGAVLLLAMATLSSLVAINCHMLFESYASGAVSFLLWFICGLGVGVGNLHNHSNEGYSDTF